MPVAAICFRKSVRAVSYSNRASGAGGYEMYVGCKIIKHFTKDIFEILLEYIDNEKTGNESGGGAVQYPSV